jgi:peptide/nickel transport system substrate-binding protein/microcin C transport system substrate-binding protein
MQFRGIKLPAIFIPRVAESWEWSKDKKSITFQLRKDVQFHDGKPLTAEDVKFSFDAIFNPAYMAAHLRPYYEKN